MGYIVKMPKLGLEMEQGILLEWTIDTGEKATEGEKIAEVESEKSIGEVETREDGFLRQTYLEEGDAVPPGTPIGILASAEADIADLEAEVEAELEGETVESGVEEPQSAGAETTESPESASSAASDIKASPRAKKRAEELGVELADIDGTGPQGSITADDVEAAAAAEPAANTAEVRRIEPEQAGGYRYDRVTAVADPGVGETIVETTEAVRSAFEEGVEITDVLLVIASATLSDRPAVNGTYEEATHHLQEQQDIALVTDVDGEPIAGVVTDVEGRSLTELIEQRQELEAGSGEKPSFTLANAAETAFDSLLVNQPGVASLDIDPSGRRAVPADDDIDLQPLVTARVTYDTRAIDAAEAEAFLERFFDRAGEAETLVLGTYRGSE
jgi:pyruvate/2-oxoglutarate dehydrogenase complex dihydrolipoamide acyltransferase (E2) component